MIYVFDSTPLIHLNKVNKLDIIKKLSGDKYTTQSVFAEVITAAKEKGRDVMVLESFFNKNIIKIKDPKNKDCIQNMLNIPKLDSTDVDVLCLAKELNSVAIIDETRGRNAAFANGIKYTGTAGILIKLVKLKILSKKETKNVFESIVLGGWRCSTEFYAVFLDELENV